MSYKLTLYKYKPLTNEDEFEHIESFFDQHIWLPPLSNLNDPFEGSFRLTPAKFETVQNIPELMQEISDICMKNGSTENTLIDDINKLLMALEEQGSAAVLDQFSRFGAFSFTDSPLNIPMWAYYGNYHKGYCIVFEVDFSDAFTRLNLTTPQKVEYMELLKNGEEPLTFSSVDKEFDFAFVKIRYATEMPEINFEEALQMRDKDNATKMRYLLKYAYGVKFKQWEHESEFRLIANANSIDHYNSKPISLMYAPFVKITGIVMGKDTNCENKFIDLCKKHHMDLYQARCSRKSYKMTMVTLLEKGQLVTNSKFPAIDP